jgi:GNAT superfamily N-acetyltransferase
VLSLAAIRRSAILVLAAPEMGKQSAREWADSSADERVLRAIVDHEVWVAEHDEVALGWVEIDRARVEGLYVSPDRARAGLGAALLQHAEDRIRAAGHAAIALHSSPNAEAFYLRRGYELQAEQPDDAGRPMRKSVGAARPGRETR